MSDFNKYLSIVALGGSRDKLARDLVRAIVQRGCNIHECRIAQLGDRFSAALLLTGDWSVLGKMESALPGLAEQLGLELTFQHTRPAERARDYRPYAAEATAPEKAGVLNELCDFFAAQGIRVTEINAQAYESTLTGAPLCTLQFALQVPVSLHPQTLRDAYMDLCDDLHADGLLDPIKN